MKKVSLIISILVLIGIGSAFALDQINIQGTWRYKITVNVDTPEGLKSGSAVRELWAYVPPIRLPDAAPAPSVNGEAVVVDLGERGILFALISSGSYTEFTEAFPFDAPLMSAESIDYYTRLKPGKTVPITDNIPTMVTFANISDPKSVMPVNKLDMSKTFGEGFALNSVTIEITDEPLAWGLVDRFLPDALLFGFQDWWKTLPVKERMKLSKLYQFKQGEPK